jgi:hypothetical protein
LHKGQSGSSLPYPELHDKLQQVLQKRTRVYRNTTQTQVKDFREPTKPI